VAMSAYQSYVNLLGLAYQTTRHELQVANEPARVTRLLNMTSC